MRGPFTAEAWARSWAHTHTQIATTCPATPTGIPIQPKRTPPSTHGSTVNTVISKSSPGARRHHSPILFPALPSRDSKWRHPASTNKAPATADPNHTSGDSSMDVFSFKGAQSANKFSRFSDLSIYPSDRHHQTPRLTCPEQSRCCGTPPGCRVPEGKPVPQVPQGACSMGRMS